MGSVVGVVALDVAVEETCAAVVEEANAVAEVEAKVVRGEDVVVAAAAAVFHRG